MTAELRTPAQVEPGVRLRYVTRTAQRGARRVHVWREEPSTIEPEYAYTSVALCGGVDRQVLPHQVPAVADPLEHPIAARDITCDRCLVAYERILTQAAA